jgi:hypothetical protein
MLYVRISLIPDALDQMGMGKSLSVLALILRTLETAHQWSAHPDKTSANVWRAKPRSSATLIVASSDRTYLYLLAVALPTGLTCANSHDQRMVPRTKEVGVIVGRG